MALVTLDDTDAEGAIQGAPDAEGSLVLDDLPGFFRLYYQPEFDLVTGEVTACEALLRWWHPEYGLLRPGASLHQTRWSERLPLLERWAIEAASEQAATWDHDGRGLMIALNVSRRLLRDGGLPQAFAAAIDSSGAPAHLLGVDLPFGAFVRRPERAVAAADALRDLGVVVIADDVSGDLELAHLANPPVSVFKIPLYPRSSRRSGLHPSAAAAVALAHRIEAIAVAKAVENSAELGTLRALGFDRAFGHVYSPAITPEGLESLLDRLARDGEAPDPG